MIEHRRRWEIIIPTDQLNEFRKLSLEIDGEDYKNYILGDSVWIIAYPSEEMKLLTKLKMKVLEMGFGIDCQFDNLP